MVWAQAALLFLGTVAAVIVPNNGTDADANVKHITSDAGSTVGSQTYTLSYLVPCHSHICTPHPGNSEIQIDLKVLSSDQECGSQNTVFLNEVAVPFTDWHDAVRGQLVFEARQPAAPAVSVFVKAFVQMKCLDGNTSLLSMRIINFNAKPGPNLAGFTVSFRQQNGVKRVLQKDMPLTDIRNPKLDKEWSGREWFDQQDMLAQEYQKLETIETEIRRLRQDLYQQQKRVKVMIMNEFQTCLDFYCYLRAAKEKAPYLRSVIKKLFDQTRTHRVTAAASDQITIKADDIAEYTTAQYERPESDSYTPPAGQYSGSPSSNDHWAPIGINGYSPSTVYVPVKRPFAYRHRVPIIISAVLTAVFSLLFIITILLKKKKIKWCIDPRWKRDCATLHEERRTRAAYRRAAYRQKIQRWWDNIRKPRSTCDYEEKRARIFSQEGILENAMQGEITHLQRAHEIATDMMRAEQGRQRLYHEANFGRPISPPRAFAIPHNRVGRDNGDGSSVASGNTLPLYSGPPPSYRSDLGGEMTVVDGFNYTPSHSDITSESSIVDCSSRISFDTDSTGQRD